MEAVGDCFNVNEFVLFIIQQVTRLVFAIK